eukprot:7386333-Prymnesium_polylepis.3
MRLRRSGPARYSVRGVRGGAPASISAHPQRQYLPPDHPLARIRLRHDSRAVRMLGNRASPQGVPP